MRSNNVSRALVLGLLLAAGACATATRRPEAATAQRVPDSTPEKSAALRSATPGLALEAEDARWGIEAAKQRKHDRAQPPAPPPTSPGFRTATEVQIQAQPPARQP